MPDGLPLNGVRKVGFSPPLYVNPFGSIILPEPLIGRTDFLPTVTIAAKNFATEITIFNAKENDMETEQDISAEHVTNNKTVRETLISRGITPENLPPAEDVKKVERRLKSDEKKSLKKNSDSLTDKS